MSEPEKPMTEEERQRLIAQYKDLKERAEATLAAHKKQQRTEIKWGRLALVGLALASVGAGIYVATSSVLWATLGTAVGVPVAVLAGVLIVAAVQHAAAERERKLEVPMGSGRAIADPEKQLARVETDLTGDRLALWLCQFFDYCVVRYSAKRWEPSNPGGRLIPRAMEWLRKVAAQLRDGSLSGDEVERAGDLGGWRPSPERLTLTRESVDVEVRIVRGTKGYTRYASEAMGMLQRGDVLSDSFLAIAAQVLGSGKVDAGELCSMLLAQCETYQARGNEIPEAQAMNEALAKHPAFAARLKGG
jgi:hypothetical protein